MRHDDVWDAVYVVVRRWDRDKDESRICQMTSEIADEVMQLAPPQVSEPFVALVKRIENVEGFAVTQAEVNTGAKARLEHLEAAVNGHSNHICTGWCRVPGSPARSKNEAYL